MLSQGEELDQLSHLRDLNLRLMVEKDEAGGTLVRADASQTNMCDSVQNPTCFSRNLVCAGT